MRIFVLFATAISLTAQVTVVVSPQDNAAVKTVTGVSLKKATLERLNVCNEGEASAVSTDRITAAVILEGQYGLYGSDVVADVLAALQAKDAFTRAQKIINAGVNTATLLAAVFKAVSPLTVTALQVAPAIAEAILPAVGSPRDLIDLNKQLMQDNGAIALGRKGSGNDCSTRLVVAMTSAVKITKVVVQ